MCRMYYLQSIIYNNDESSLLQLSSGVVAEQAVASDLLMAKDEGEKLFLQFVSTRVQSNSVKFFRDT